MISKEVMTDVYVFGAGVLNWVVFKFYDTFIVTQQGALSKTTP